MRKYDFFFYSSNPVNVPQALLSILHRFGTNCNLYSCLKLIAAAGFPEKRIGYLGLMRAGDVPVSQVGEYWASYNQMDVVKSTSLIPES